MGIYSSVSVVSLELEIVSEWHRCNRFKRVYLSDGCSIHYPVVTLTAKLSSLRHNIKATYLRSHRLSSCLVGRWIDAFKSLSSNIVSSTKAFTFIFTQRALEADHLCHRTLNARVLHVREIEDRHLKIPHSCSALWSATRLLLRARNVCRHQCLWCK
jgi:hypothetical protein